MSLARTLARLEAWCAQTVEHAFAAAFPTPLEPVRIARKIVSAFESEALPPRTVIARIIVRISTHDRLRLDGECETLERQWTEMTARLAARAGRADRPEVSVEAAVGQPRGTILTVVLRETEFPKQEIGCALRVGEDPDAFHELSRPLVIGRDKECDIVLSDPRVSRRHLRVQPQDGGAVFTDLGSSNGVFLNGAKRVNGALSVGDVLRLGDSEVFVVSQRRGS